MFKEVIIFTAGAVIGAASTYYLLKDKFEQRSKDEIAAVRKYYWDKYPEKRNGAAVHEVQNPTIPGMPSEKLFNDYTKVLDIAKKNDYVSYDRITAASIDDHPEDDDDLGDIYSIPAEKFDSDINYDGFTLTWYEGDNSLVREDGSLADIHECIGDSLKLFNGNDKEVIYVRNENHGCDYEVIRDEGNYSVDVLGEDDE
jgi:hypothetical protein